MTMMTSGASGLDLDRRLAEASMARLVKVPVSGLDRRLFTTARPHDEMYCIVCTKHRLLNHVICHRPSRLTVLTVNEKGLVVAEFGGDVSDGGGEDTDADVDGGGGDVEVVYKGGDCVQQSEPVPV
jgi:hypothetical protein